MAKFALFHRSAPDRVLCKQGHEPLISTKESLPHRDGALRIMLGCQLPRFSVLRTRVNKGKNKGPERLDPDPSSWPARG
jgi:hypothetical protein